MAVQTSFAKKVTYPQHCDHRLLAVLGNDSELNLPFLDVIASAVSPCEKMI